MRSSFWELASGYLELSAKGRGRQYHPWRALMERVLGVVYRDGWAARLWAYVPGSTRVALSEHRLELLPPGTPKLLVAFVSDLHIGPTTPEVLLDQAFALLRSLAPDVLLLGGDYIFLQATKERAERLRQLVASVPAKAKLAVLGNHDLWTEHGLLESALAAAGCRVLINDAARLPPPYDAVCVVGIDEPWTGSPQPDIALSACPPQTQLRILLCHSPDGFLMVPNGIGLYVAGHTHGGHIALPGGRAVVLPPGPGSRRWPRGFHPFGDGHVYVSRGLGATEVPVRSFSTPEVALFTLSPREA